VTVPEPVFTSDGRERSIADLAYHLPKKVFRL
jgi:hypothetical protein